MKASSVLNGATGRTGLPVQIPVVPRVPAYAPETASTDPQEKRGARANAQKQNNVHSGTG